MATKHSSDCTIYGKLSDSSPEYGICICGAGYERWRENGGNTSELYSNELMKKLEEGKTLLNPEKVNKLITKLFGD